MDETGKVVVFTDLDNCIFQSLYRMGPGDFTPVAFTRAGMPQGAMHPYQDQLWEFLQKADLVVPTTGRCPEQLARVSLHFGGPAVCLQGAVILDSGGVEDMRWWSNVENASEQLKVTLVALAERLSRRLEPKGVRVCVVTHSDMPLYLELRSVDKGTPFDETSVLRLAEEHMLPDWSTRRDVGRLIVLPPHLGKELAVRHMLKTIRPALSIGVGHSEADEPFMGSCHVSMRIENQGVAV